MKSIMKKQQQSGFALLFTVLVITLVLTITVGISSTTFKQGILSGLARDSQTAFYQADKLLECALLYRNVSNQGLYDGKNASFNCGSVTYQKAPLPIGSNSSELYYRNASLQSNISPCAVLRVIPKNDTSMDDTASLQVSGYNICQAHPRQVERTLLATF